MTPTVHASAAALRLNGQWKGVMFRGPSGAGKSDMVLRLIDTGAKLVGDDRLHLWTDNNSLYARCPDRICGLLEIRGLGIKATEHLPFNRIHLVIDLVKGPVERMPQARTIDLCGVAVPLLEVDPRTPSATTLVRRALEGL